MAIPGVGSDPIALLKIYREAWIKADHPGQPKMMMAVFMFCHEDGDRARSIAKPHIEGHFAQIVDAMKEYSEGETSKAYKNYDVLKEKIASQTLESQIDCGAAFVGNPADIIQQLEDFDNACGGCDELSLQVNPFGLKLAEAEASMRLFGKEVMPNFR
jgi:alkanesulfonate monooxygenase SsuD/methylene tetrahydromethanopterin reductase-like flavin-dependent oxidoreductase (luciferase family)